MRRSFAAPMLAPGRSAHLRKSPATGAECARSMPGRDHLANGSADAGLQAPAAEKQVRKERQEAAVDLGRCVHVLEPTVTSSDRRLDASCAANCGGVRNSPTTNKRRAAARASVLSSVCAVPARRSSGPRTTSHRWSGRRTIFVPFPDDHGGRFARRPDDRPDDLRAHTSAAAVYVSGRRDPSAEGFLAPSRCRIPPRSTTVRRSCSG